MKSLDLKNSDGDLKTSKLRKYKVRKRSGSNKMQVLTGRELRESKQNGRQDVADIGAKALALEIIFDYAADHLVTRNSAGEIIGYCRFIKVPTNSPSLLEHSIMYNVACFPLEWISGGVMEVSRAWVAESLKKKGLFIEMIRYLVGHSFHIGARYIVLSSDETLSKLYQKMGCKVFTKFITDDKKSWVLHVFDTHQILNSEEFLVGESPIIEIE